MKTNDLTRFYKKHYNLKVLKLPVSNKKLLVLVFDDKYYYYLEKDKFPEYNKTNSILNLVDEISNTYKLKIKNYYPVCFCNDTLVFAFRVGNVESSELNRVPINQIPEKYKKLVKFHIDNFNLSYISSTVNTEIETSLKYINRYKFHEKYIKRYILTEKKRKKTEFKKMIYDILPNKESIIDISCGDSTDLFEVASKHGYKTVVGNDVCIKYLSQTPYKNVVYTNDNVEYNNIKNNSYDIVFCKNTLHHMNSLIGINNLLNLMDNISKTGIVIIEIIDPREHLGLPKLLNKWLYRKFLKDKGECFLNEMQFKSVVSSSFKEYDIKYDMFTNILGKYMVAYIKKED